jgi:hypothetical protein
MSHASAALSEGRVREIVREELAALSNGIFDGICDGIRPLTSGAAQPEGGQS